MCCAIRLSTHTISPRDTPISITEILFKFTLFTNDLLDSSEHVCCIGRIADL
jgi:hypothetical protein